jgi:DNA polymerase I
MLDPIKQKPIGRAEVVEKFGVQPEKVVDVQALAGDSTDNVPGVPGIGVKTAAQLITEYGDLETLLARRRDQAAQAPREADRERRAGAHLQEAGQARSRGADRDDLDDFALKQPVAEDLRAFLERYEFRSLLRRLSDQLGGDAEETATAAEAPPESAKEASYELVQDLPALERWVAAAQLRGVIAVDTETTSLDPLAAELVGISLATAPGKACYVPVGHKGAGPAEGNLDLDGTTEAPRQIPLQQAIAALKPLLEDPGVLKIGQNIKYDMLVLPGTASRWRRSTTPCCCPTCWKAACTATAWTSWRSCTSTTRPSSSRTWPAAARRRSPSTRCRSTRRCDYAAEDADVTLRSSRC